MWGLIASGNIGIDIFLFFSAFFQTHKILKFARLANGFSPCSVVTIYFNRFSRLIPSYYFVFITSLSFIWLFARGNFYDMYLSLFE